MAEELAACVRAAAEQSDACAAVLALYDRLSQEIDRRRPVCRASGACCRFEAYGHRLYVTTLELATFVRDWRARESPAEPAGKTALPQWRERDPGGCMFQLDGLCSVHAIRPFGCRIFFCDPTATQWQQDTYERFHAELKELHQRFDIPYRYIEWRAALREVEQLATNATSTHE